jgi:hypothetical protein
MHLYRTAVAAAVLLAAPLAWTPGAQSQAPAIESIRQADLRADLFFLASDALAGRLTNTRENRIAAEWIKARFERLGLAPGVPGYFQEFGLATVSLGPTNTMTVTRSGSIPQSVTHGEGFTAQRFSPTASGSGPVVFAGYGISAPDIGHDDYRDRDRIRGAVVLVLDHEPGERDPASRFDGVVTSDAGGALRKAQAAQAAGAAAILFVSDVHNHGAAAAGRAGRGGRGGRGAWSAAPSRLGRYTLSDWMRSLRIPAAQITAELAADLASGTGLSFEDLARTADTPGGTPPAPLPGVEVDLTISVDRRDTPDRNVLAVLEGSDARLRDEWIVLSAHYDHDGATDQVVYNGADDDGSGTVGVLELAEAFADAAAAGRRPRRSILFAQFNSEERGLLGAWAYTLHPIAPLERTIAVLNMDMIGRNEEVPAEGGNRFNGLEPQTAESNRNALNVLGSVRAPGLRAAIDRANRALGLDIRYRYDNNASQLMRRSDQWPFIQNGVPGVWIFTGLHLDYHTGNDTPDRINYEKMERILKLVYQVTWDLAEADGRPALATR